MESPKRVLGIEGGGTKTDWVLLTPTADGQTILAQGQLPAANLKLLTDEALAHLFRVLPSDATHVGAFLAGCATTEDRRRLQHHAQQAWPDAQIAIGSDRDSGLATAFGDADGIAVIAGTGAAVHGRKEGKTEKAGGWGQLLGDRGGGYHLAMQGLRLVLSRFDLDQKITMLGENVLRQLGLNRLQDLVDWVSQADKMSVARLAPVVFDAARRSEPEVLAIVQEGADILARYTTAVAQRLQFEEAAVKLIGGVFTGEPEYVALFKYRLSILLPKATVDVCREPGCHGAAWLAMKAHPEARVIKPAVDTEVKEELAAAATEQGNPRSSNLDQLSAEDFVDLFISEEVHVQEALAGARRSFAEAVDLAGELLRAGGRLFYVGAGTSGRLGVLDASEIPPTFGAPAEMVQGIMAGGVMALHRAVEGAEDQPQAGALAVLERGVREGDVVCGITASGRTPFVLGALSRARVLGAKTMLVTCNPSRHRDGTESWDVEIDLQTGPEIVTGSTRLKAGTATKVALNLISTGAMVRLGRVRGNAMVDVNISNVKLRDRGIRLVSEQCGIPYNEARVRLEMAGWNVRACLRAVQAEAPIGGS